MRNLTRIFFVLLVGASLAMASGVFAKRAASAQIQGTHKLKIVGDLSGSGKAVLSDRSIKFTLQLSDDSGKGCNSDSGDIDFGDNRFSGTIQIDGQTATVSGRVDLAAAGKKPRVSGFIRIADGRVARIANSLKIADSSGEGDDDDDDTHGHDGTPSTQGHDDQRGSKNPTRPPTAGTPPKHPQPRPH